MADRTRTITLTVKDDFSRQLQNFARQVGTAGDAVDGIPQRNQDLGKTADRFNEIAQAAQTLFNWGSQAVAQVIDLANQGIAIAQTAESFERLAGGSEEANRWIQEIKEASRGGLTDFEATNTAVQLMTMGLAESADEAGRFMEIAAITKAINPELGTMENTIMNIGMTLANDSWMRLDQLGVDASKLKERMGELEKQGIAASEAFDIGVMEQLEENAARIGTDVLEIGASTTEMQAQWRELKDSAAEFALVITEEISPALSFALSQMTTFVGGWNALLSGDVNLSGYNTSDAETRAAYSESLAGFVSPQEQALNQWFAANNMVQNENGEWVFATEDNAAFRGIQMAYGAPMRTGTGMEGAAALQALMSFGQESMLPTFGGTATGLPAFDPASLFQTATSFDKGALFSDTFGTGAGDTGTLPGMAYGDIALNLDAGREAAIGFLDAARDVREEAQAFASLDEKFQLEDDSFAADVLGEMKDAFRDVEVEADKAAAAMEAYQLMTGLATGSSQLFDEQLERITQQFNEGQFSANEYARLVNELSMMDLENVNALVGGLIQGGDLEGAQAMIQELGQMDLSQLQEQLSMMAPQGAEEGEGESIFQTMLDDAAELEQGLTDSSKEVADAWIEQLAAVNTQGTEEFTSLRDSGIGLMEEMTDYINTNFAGATFTFTAQAMVGNTQIGNMSSGGNTLVPAFAEGGFTGYGSEPFLAMLHPNEMVIPMDKVALPGSGGNGDLQVDLYIDGRQVEATVTNVKRLKNEVW